MLKVKDITDFLENSFPLSYAEDFDNPGLLIGKSDGDVSSVLICLDCTMEIVDEAIERGANLIISHHPFIFEPIKSISSDTYIGKMAIKLIENKISVYSAHTNLDNAPGGLTDFIAKKLNFKTIGTIEGNLGRILAAPDGFTASLLIERIKNVFNIKTLYSTLREDKKVSVIALLNGSGSDFASKAAKLNADIYISGDLKHHNILTLKEYENLDYIEIRHHECEMPMTELVCTSLTCAFGSEASFNIASGCNAPLIDTDDIIC